MNRLFWGFCAGAGGILLTVGALAILHLSGEDAGPKATWIIAIYGGVAAGLITSIIKEAVEANTGWDN